jgi:Zn-dependent M16 (insulinase) family peptidase
VFFSRLDPLDFSQEGHRLEFENGDPAAPLQFKGVVFNEMKGDTSSPSSMLYHAIQEKLYPTTTYHYNSGGDPVHIPDLSYDDLMAFYRSHYHPANAIFMTFGNISAAEQQENMNAFALDRLKPEGFHPLSVSMEKRYRKPLRHEVTYPVDDGDTAGKTHIVMSWLLGDNTDLEKLLEGHLLSDVLLDTSASPLRQALETFSHATGVSSMSGFEEDHHEMNFMCGIEGSDPEHADALERLVLDVLQQVAEDGIEEDRLAAVLHQLELSQREIGGDGAPYGLQLIFSCMSAAVHGGDPIGLLDIDPVLRQLRDSIRDPEFIKSLVREQLLDNPHRVLTVMKPDAARAVELIREEQERLNEIRSSLSDADCQRILSVAQQLEARQGQEEDLSVLPAVGLADIPEQRGFPSMNAPDPRAGLPLTACDAGTNGLVYHQVIRNMPSLPEPLLGLLPLYSQVITEVGSGGRDYLQTQHLQHSVSGGISAFSSFRAEPEDCDSYSGFFTLSSRTLAAQAEDMAQLLLETAQSSRFDESDRIRELVQQLALRRINSIAGNGHQYAMSAAAARLRPVSALSHFLTGVPGAMRLKRLADSLNDPTLLDHLCRQLAELHQLIKTGSTRLLLVGEQERLDDFSRMISALWQECGAAPMPAPRQSATRFPVDSSADTAYVVTTQVNYCAAAYATVPESHDDAAALSILGALLRNNYLHTELREKGGAYGGGAGHDSTNGVFRFYSYRDPGIAATFETFTRSIAWVMENTLKDEMLEEAVLGLIGSIDAPGSPAGEIRQAYHHLLFGRTAATREARRASFLQVRLPDVRRVAETYLQSEPARAIVTSETRLDELDRFEIIRVQGTPED